MKYFLFLLVVISMVSCSNKQSSVLVPDYRKPDSLIPRSRMVRILTDVQLAEAAISSVKAKGDAPENLSRDYYNAVFSKYRISKKNYEENVGYYANKPEEMIKMYDEVITSLENLKKQSQPK
jgi:hypothetical protein